MQLLFIGVAVAAHAAYEVGRVCSSDGNGVVAGKRYVVFGETYYCRFVDYKRLVREFGIKYHL